MEQTKQLAINNLQSLLDTAIFKGGVITNAISVLQLQNDINYLSSLPELPPQAASNGSEHTIKMSEVLKTKT